MYLWNEWRVERPLWVAFAVKAFLKRFGEAQPLSCDMSNLWASLDQSDPYTRPRVALVLSARVLFVLVKRQCDNLDVETHAVAACGVCLEKVLCGLLQ